MIQPAAEICATADYFIVVGTSLAVYPAASLIHYVPAEVPKFVVDPNEVRANVPNVTYIKSSAGEGLRMVAERIAPLVTFIC